MRGATGRVVLLKAFSDIAVRASGLITFPVMAHYVGAAGYGSFGQVNTIVGLIVPFASLGLGGAMVRSFAGLPWTREIRRQVGEVTALVIAVGLVTTLLMALGAPLFNSLFLNAPDGTELFRWGSLFILIGALETYSLDVMRARSWLLQYSMFQLAMAAVVTGATVIALPHGATLVELIQVTAAVKALVVIVNTAILFATRRPHGTLGDVEMPGFESMLRFGLPFTVAGLGLFLMNFGDRLVVGAYMSPADIGRYVAVFALASVLLLASGPLFLPFYPQLMAAVRADDKQAMARTFSIYSRYLSLSLIPFACYLAVIIGPVQILLAGEEFRVSNLLVVLVVAGVFLDQWNGLSHYVLYCYDKAVLSQNLWLGFGGLNVLLNLAAVPLFGLVGSAAVTLLTFAMLEAWMFVTANRLAGVARHYRWDAAIKAFASGAAGVVAAVAVLGVVAAHAPRVLAATAAFWIVCAAAGIATRAIDRSDLERLLSAVGLRRAMPVQG